MLGFLALILKNSGANNGRLSHLTKQMIFCNRVKMPLKENSPIKSPHCTTYNLQFIEITSRHLLKNIILLPKIFPDRNPKKIHLHYENSLLPNKPALNSTLIV
jgi:hypothetical protein